jgi:hypothetical protein
VSLANLFEPLPPPATGPKLTSGGTASLRPREVWQGGWLAAGRGRGGLLVGNGENLHFECHVFVA